MTVIEVVLNIIVGVVFFCLGQFLRQKWDKRRMAVLGRGKP